MFQEIVWRIHTFCDDTYRGILVGHDRDFIYVRDSSTLKTHNCKVLDSLGDPIKIDHDNSDPWPGFKSEVRVKKATSTSYRAYRKGEIVRINLASEEPWWEKDKLPNPYGLDQWQKAHQRKLIRERLNQEPSFMMKISDFVVRAVNCWR